MYHEWLSGDRFEGAMPIKGRTTKTLVATGQAFVNLREVLGRIYDGCYPNADPSDVEKRRRSGILVNAQTKVKAICHGNGKNALVRVGVTDAAQYYLRSDLLNFVENFVSSKGFWEDFIVPKTEVNNDYKVSNYEIADLAQKIGHMNFSDVVSYARIGKNQGRLKKHPSFCRREYDIYSLAVNHAILQLVNNDGDIYVSLSDLIYLLVSNQNRKSIVVRNLRERGEIESKGEPLDVVKMAHGGGGTLYCQITPEAIETILNVTFQSKPKYLRMEKESAKVLLLQIYNHVRDFFENLFPETVKSQESVDVEANADNKDMTFDKAALEEAVKTFGLADECAESMTGYSAKELELQSEEGALLEDIQPDEKAADDKTEQVSHAIAPMLNEIDKAIASVLEATFDAIDGVKGENKTLRDDLFAATGRSVEIANAVKTLKEVTQESFTAVIGKIALIENALEKMQTDQIKRDTEDATYRGESLAATAEVLDAVKAMPSEEAIREIVRDEMQKAFASTTGMFGKTRRLLGKVA